MLEFNKKNAQVQAEAKLLISKDQDKLLEFNKKNSDLQSKIKSLLNDDELFAIKVRNKLIKKNIDIQRYIDQYFKFINEPCNNICCSCGGIWFSSSITNYNKDSLKTHILYKNKDVDFLEVISFIELNCEKTLVVLDNYCLCSTCNLYILKMEVSVLLI